MSERFSILVPTDFSESSAFAVDFAIQLASRTRGRIELLHAYGVPGRALSPYDVVLPDQVLLSVRDTATRRLLKTLQQVEAAGIDGDLHLCEASAPRAIADRAAELDVDWIVMGTRGLSGLKSALLGSVAERSLRIAPRPVVGVREHPRPDALPLSRILVPTDLGDETSSALDLAMEVSTRFGPAHIEIVHAYQLPSALDVQLAASSSRVVDEWRASLREELDAVTKRVSEQGFAASSQVIQGRPAQVIVKHAATTETDLVVMATHGRTGLPHAVLGSVAERVLRAAPCPVLTLKP